MNVIRGGARAISIEVPSRTNSRDARRGEPSVSPLLERQHAANITTRRLSPSDSLQELTTLLHRAYAKQVAMGLRPLAEITTRCAAN